MSVFVIFVIFVSAFHPAGLGTSSMTRGSIIEVVLGRRRSSTSRGSSPAELCWSSAPLVQCGPGEPSWMWTKTWVQARMPDYNLNWTARSSAIQGVKGVNNSARPPEGSPAQLKPGAFRPQVYH